MTDEAHEVEINDGSIDNSKISRQKLAADIDKSLEELRKKKKKNKINLDIAN